MAWERGGKNFEVGSLRRVARKGSLLGHLSLPKETLHTDSLFLKALSTVKGLISSRLKFKNSKKFLVLLEQDGVDSVQKSKCARPEGKRSPSTRATPEPCVANRKTEIDSANSSRCRGRINHSSQTYFVVRLFGQLKLYIDKFCSSSSYKLCRPIDFHLICFDSQLDNNERQGLMMAKTTRRWREDDSSTQQFTRSYIDQVV